MSIINTNAQMLFDADCDFVGYAIPESDPVSIDFRFDRKFRGEDETNELVYEVRWSDGIWADMFTIPTRWNDIVRGAHAAKARRNLAAVDAALAECAKPLAEVA